MIGVTIPTVLSVGEPRFNRQQDQMVSSQLSLGGGGVQANNYTLDGVPITDMRGFPVLNPTIEAIDDVKVQVHTFDAEMGRTGGGVFNTTARSGANAFHGTAFYQDRPVWGQSLEYFSEKRGATKESSGLSESFYHLYGGGIGGPIVKNRTFFWAATEGYRDQVIQGLSRTWPSARQRIGDFSTTTLNGAPVRIFNPYCRDGVANAKCPATGTGSLATGGEFTNAIIPGTHPAANPVAFKMASYWPLPQGSNENSLSNLDTTVNLPDFADMLTFKGEHKFNDSSSLSGLFIYNQTKEPAASPVPDELSFLEQGANWLIRHPKVFVLNNTNVLSDTLVASFRYGYSVFPDGRNCRGGSPGVGCFSDGLSSLGFNQTYLSAVDDTAEEPVSQRVLPELFGRRAEPEHGADQMGKPDYAQRGAVQAGRAAHRQDRRRLPDDAAGYDAAQQHRRHVYVSESLHGRTEPRRRLRLRQLPAWRGDHRLGRLQPRRRHLFVELRRRLHPGRLARELAVHAELRSPLRARERTARTGQQHHRRIRSECHQRRAAGDRGRGPAQRLHRPGAQGRPDVRRRQRRTTTTRATRRR